VLCTLSFIVLKRPASTFEINDRSTPDSLLSSSYDLFTFLRAAAICLPAIPEHVQRHLQHDIGDACSLREGTPGTSR
jgi:hypothetical protein